MMADFKANYAIHKGVIAPQFTGTMRKHVEQIAVEKIRLTLKLSTCGGGGCAVTLIM